MNHGPRVASIFGAVGRIVGFEFLHCVDGGLEGDLAIGHIVQIDAVDQEVDCVLPISSRIDRKGALPTQRGGQKTVLWRRYGACQ